MTKRFTHNGSTYELEGSSDFDDNGRFRKGTGFHLNQVVFKGGREVGTRPLGAWFETVDQAIREVTA